MRFGNDEVKPNDMKEDAKLRDNKIEQTDTDPDVNQQNACRNEQQMLYNCINDNREDIDLCQESMKENTECERTYASHLRRSGEERD